MGENQRTLSNFDEAEKCDMANSTYFKPEVNIRYELTFCAVPFEPDPQHPHFKLVEKDIPDFNDKTRTSRKVVLILQLDSINGTKTSQEWSILSLGCRKAVQEACASGMLVKKKYAFKSSGEGKNKTFSFSEIGDR